MTAEHKAAMARGREGGRAVRAYLEALEAHRPKRGRPVATTETLTARLSEVNERVNSETDPLRRLHLVQQALDIEAELERRGADDGTDLDALEKDFVKHVKSYSTSKGLSYSAWREIGVAPRVLKDAGLSRSS
jgi:hypothetical protein